MNKGSTIGLYFPMPKGELNDLRARLNYQFGRMGYADEDSTPPWRGGLPAGLLAIDKGELALIPPLSDEQRSQATAWLYQQADEIEKSPQSSTQIISLIWALRVIADALSEAMNKQIEAEVE